MRGKSPRWAAGTREGKRGKHREGARLGAWERGFVTGRAAPAAPPPSLFLLRYCRPGDTAHLACAGCNRSLPRGKAAGEPEKQRVGSGTRCSLGTPLPPVVAQAIEVTACRFAVAPVGQSRSRQGKKSFKAAFSSLRQEEKCISIAN